MKSIAVFSVKGGVGKSALAVNLAHAAATLSARRTLLWDLDAQGAATYTLRLTAKPNASARKGFAGDAELTELIQASDFPRLDVLAADKSLRHLEKQLVVDDKAKRLKKLIKGFEKDYDRVILDCPPGLTELADQIFRGVDLLVVPLLPSPLSERAFAQLTEHLAKLKGDAPAVLPVFSMVDRRKTLHKDTVALHPDRPAIPYAAAVEAMAATRTPVLATSAATPAARAFAALWTEVERALAK